ncbi:SpoIIE family protein phosphatase [Desulfurivibrio sp. C05AmB]|uniref:SpoIIE family protein phosphatase n=1 Tax=Desulfurivibrio sp. C05AmB TaxID=3374371 RepID=UPI00376F1309
MKKDKVQMKSIRAKMLTWFGATLGILMLVFGFITYSNIKGTVIPLTQDLSQEILKARSAEVGRLIQGYLNEVKVLVGSDLIRSGNLETIGQDLLKNAEEINPDFEMILFADTRGEYITNTGDRGNVADRDYWVSIMENGASHAISDTMISKATSQSVFALAHAVTNEQGERIGIVAATVTLTTLSQIVQSINIGHSGISWIVDSSGLQVAHPDPTLTMKLNFLKSSAAGYQGLEAIGEKIIQGEAGQGLYVRPNGERFIAIFNPIPNTPGWSFGIAMLHSEFMERPEKLISNIAWLMVAMLLAMLLVIALLSGKISAPVLLLKKGVAEASTGNLDHRLDIHTGDEIQELADAFNRMTGDLKEHITRLTETTAAKERIQSELKIATDIQASLLPRIFPAFPERPEFDIFAAMDPAKEVGGDFYDFFFINQTNLCFLIADVSDKGVPAALYMMVAKTLLKSEGQRLGEPDRILAAVNNILAEGNDSCMFATVFCAILNTENGEVRFANAGHNPPLLIDAQGIHYLAMKSGFVLGPMEDTVYETERLVMQPGDTLFLYTDGVTEAANLENELYGEAQLLNSLKQKQGEPLASILQLIRAEVMKHANGAAQSDDVTMVAITYRGRPEA